MLLPDNVIPEYSLYYNGYLILNELKNLDNQYLFNLYFKVKNVNNMYICKAGTIKTTYDYNSLYKQIGVLP